MSRELLQQALDALNTCDWDYDYDEESYKTFDEDLVNAAAAALKEALAEPEQEPQMIQIKDGQLSYIKKQWVGLTDEQLSETYNELYTQYTRNDVNIADFILIARTIESKLKELNT